MIKHYRIIDILYLSWEYVRDRACNFLFSLNIDNGLK